MEATAVEGTSKVEALRRELEDLRAEVRALRNRAEVGGRPVESFRAPGDGGHEFVVLVRRDVLADDGHLRELLRQRSTLVTRIRDGRANLRRLGSALRQAARVAKGGDRTWPEVGPLEREEEAREAWRRLEAEYDEEQAAVRAAEDRIEEIADEIRRRYVALPTARPPDFGVPTLQE